MMLFYYHCVRVTISFDTSNKKNSVISGENVPLHIGIWNFIDQMKRKIQEKSKLWCYSISGENVSSPLEFKILSIRWKERFEKNCKLWYYYTTTMLESLSVLAATIKITAPSLVKMSLLPLEFDISSIRWKEKFEKKVNYDVILLWLC